MIQEAQLNARDTADLEAIDRLARLHHPQQLKGAVQHPGIGSGGNDEGAMSADRRRSQQKAFIAQILQLETQTCDRRGGSRCAENDGAFLGYLGREAGSGAEQTRERAQQFGAGSIVGCDEFLRRAPIALQPG